VLWGGVGVLGFLALLQGYRLVVAPLALDVPTAVAAALAVGGVVAGATYLTEFRLAAKGRT
jgi:hypothetical protein